MTDIFQQFFVSLVSFASKKNHWWFSCIFYNTVRLLAPHNSKKSSNTHSSCTQELDKLRNILIQDAGTGQSAD